MKRAVSLLFLLIISADSCLYADQFLHISESGSYGLRVFVKPVTTTISETMRLHPFVEGKGPELMRSTDQHGNPLNTLQLAPGAKVRLDWAPPVGTLGDLDLRKYAAFSIPSFPNLRTRTVFTIDTNQKGTPDSNLENGDLVPADSSDARAQTFAFLSETIKRTGLLGKVFRRLGLSRYSTWGVDVEGAAVTAQDGSRFDVSFSPGGQVHFKKDLWQFPAANKLEFVTFNYESENTNLVPYIKLGFKNRALFSPEVIFEEKTTKANGSIILNFGAALQRKGISYKDIVIDRLQCGFSNPEGGEASFRLLNLDFTFSVGGTGQKVVWVERSGIIYDSLNLDITSDVAPRMLRAYTELQNSRAVPVGVAFDDLAFSTEESYQVPLALVEGVTESIAEQVKPRLIDGTRRLLATPVWNAPAGGSLLARIPIDGAETEHSLLLGRFDVNIEVSSPLVLRAVFEKEGPGRLRVEVAGTNLKTGLPFLDIFRDHIVFDEQYANCLIRDISILVDYSSPRTPYDDVVLKRLDLVRLHAAPFDQKVLVTGLGLTVSKPPGKKREFSINGKLSKGDLMNGGAWFTVSNDLPLAEGNYEMVWQGGDAFAVDEVLAVRGNVYIYSSAERENSAASSGAGASSGTLIKLALVLLTAAACFALLVLARRKRWISSVKDLFDRVFSYKQVFLGAQVVLMPAGLWLWYRQLRSGDRSTGLLLLLLSYNLWVRYRLRGWAQRYWKVINQRRTVFYFGAAIAGLVLCAALIMINRQHLAESVAVMVYLLLLEGVGIEIYLWIRNRKQVEL